MQWSLVHYQPIQLKKSIDVDSPMTDLNEKRLFCSSLELGILFLSRLKKNRIILRNKSTILIIFTSKNHEIFKMPSYARWRMLEAHKCLVDKLKSSNSIRNIVFGSVRLTSFATHDTRHKRRSHQVENKCAFVRVFQMTDSYSGLPYSTIAQLFRIINSWQIKK